MNSSLFVFLQVLTVLAFNTSSISAQTCQVIGAIMNPGTYSVNNQNAADSSGFCVEYLVGTFSAYQLFLIQFTSVNINCTNGDQLTITNGDRSAIVFNYCSPVANQLSNSLLSQNTFVFISLTSKTKTNLSYYFAFYFVDNSGMTVATRTLAPVTTTTQPIIIKTTTT